MIDKEIAQKILEGRQKLAFIFFRSSIYAIDTEQSKEDLTLYLANTMLSYGNVYLYTESPLLTTNQIINFYEYINIGHQKNNFYLYHSELTHNALEKFYNSAMEAEEGTLILDITSFHPRTYPEVFSLLSKQHVIIFLLSHITDINEGIPPFVDDILDFKYEFSSSTGFFLESRLHKRKFGPFRFDRLRTKIVDAVTGQ